MPGVVTFGQFGRWGRAGNQFFQYAFLKCYTRRHGLELQLPKWVGSHLFGCSDPEPNASLRPWKEVGRGHSQPTTPKEGELINRDFKGYAQYHTSWYTEEERGYLRSLFTPIPAIQERMVVAVNTLRDSSRLVIGLHLRRGDYGQNIFPIVPTDWYLSWLNRHWHLLDNPSLFIATEDPSLVPLFQKYSPRTVETLGLELDKEPMANCTYLKRDEETHDPRAMDWYPDFHLLSQCDVVIGPNSSFSFFATMLNPHPSVSYWRGSLAAARRTERKRPFVLTDPWNNYPQLREDVRDYPELDGIALKSNPYW